jgi:competence protein ComEC
MKFWKYTFFLLSLILTLVLIAIFQLPDGNLHIIACDVGQGDAILVIYKNIQILTDGGPDDKVISCLGKYLPFWDRNIELVISTHPDADHSTGLIDVVKKYNVGSILINPVEVSTETIRVLQNAVGSRGVRVIRPGYGMGLGLDLIHLDILSRFDPQISDTNANSVVYKLKFGKFLALFPGDIPQNAADALAGTVGPVNYIKIPHHGSKNGLTDNLLKATMPKIAVISVSKKNSWGFPSPEILEMLKNYNVKVLRTDEMGDVEVVTDGEKIWWKN